MDTRDNPQWRDMMQRSFEPRQWYEKDEDCSVRQQERRRTVMWVYRKTEPGLWTVGFYTPDRQWVSESDHDSQQEAANRVHWLNGGANN